MIVKGIKDQKNIESNFPLWGGLIALLIIIWLFKVFRRYSEKQQSKYTEPPPDDDPLRGLDNVVLTPHVSFYSEESLQALRRRTAESVVDVLAGRPAEHVYNREALG